MVVLMIGPTLNYTATLPISITVIIIITIIITAIETGSDYRTPIDLNSPSSSLSL